MIHKSSRLEIDTDNHFVTSFNVGSGKVYLPFCIRSKNCCGHSGFFQQFCIVSNVLCLAPFILRDHDIRGNALL